MDTDVSTGSAASSPGERGDASSQDAPAVPARRRRRLRWVALVVGLGLLAGGTWFAVRWSQRGADEASLSEARARVKGTEVKAGLLQPASGLYTYSSDGTEKLSLLGTTQEWGATIPATVTAAADGCYVLRLDYSTYHWNAQTYCPVGRVLEETTSQGYQAFDFVATTIGEQTDWVCDPPGEAVRLDADPGRRWKQSCSGSSATRGTSVTSAGTNEFVGEETLRIEGEEVPVLHYRTVRDLTGDQTGHEENQLWYHARTGLMVKTVRNVRVASPSPIGDVIYEESGELVLTSLTPTP